jgi:hypothetical protein
LTRAGQLSLYQSDRDLREAPSSEFESRINAPFRLKFVP